jgi:hypothetical protein
MPYRSIPPVSARFEKTYGIEPCQLIGVAQASRSEPTTATLFLKREDLWRLVLTMIGQEAPRPRILIGSSSFPVALRLARMMQILPQTPGKFSSR